MSRRGRLGLFAVAAAGLGVLLVLAYLGLSDFGTQRHPYGDRAIQAAVHARHTANTVASVTFDQRALDTLGEEFIMFCSVIAAAVLLRPEPEEVDEDRAGRRGRVLDATRLTGFVFLPVTLLIGYYIVAHGHLTPGGGFQGGVILATGLHLLYLAGDYPALRGVRPVRPYDIGEAVSAGAFVAIGLAGLGLGAAFLFNMMPYGTLRQLASAGTVPVLNTIVGLEVGTGTVVLLAKFFEQDLQYRSEGEGRQP